MLILHGENQVASREQLILAKQNQPTVELGTVVSLERLVATSTADLLFGGEKAVVLENIFSGRPANERKAVIDYLAKHQGANIIVWEGKDVSAKLKGFDPRLVRRFDLPKYIFGFLDRPTISGLHQVLQTMPAEQVLACLATRAHKRAHTRWLKELLDIDYAQKTSAVPYDLATALQLFVIRLK